LNSGKNLTHKEDKTMNEERKQSMKTCTVLRVLAVVLAFACIAIAADAPKLKIKFTTVGKKNAQSTHVYGVNNAGVIWAVLGETQIKSDGDR